MKKYFKPAQKEPSLHEIGRQVITMLIILGLFAIGVLLFFWWLTLISKLSKPIFYLGFICCFLFILSMFILFVIGCVRYAKTEINRQKTVFKKAIKQVKGGENRWQ